MKKNADITFRDNTFFIVGDLDFSNVMSVYEKSLLSLDQVPELEFDFSQLASSDSSGLALLIEWVKFAKKHHKPIRFTSLSDDIKSIGRAAGLDQLLFAKQTESY